MKPMLPVLLLAFSLFSCAGTPTGPPATAETAGLNARFLSEDLDVERFVEVFEGESREIFAQRREITEALGIEPGSSVADIGAGTGLFMPLFSEAVGTRGTVHAVEISPRFLDHLRERAREGGHDSVRVVRGTARSVELPAAAVDLAFVCDTYHHFEHPADTLASLHAALRPGGELVVIDFERVPGKSSEFILKHVRADKDAFRAEIEAAGFEWVEQVDVEGLTENYVLRFRRP